MEASNVQSERTMVPSSVARPRWSILWRMVEWIVAAVFIYAGVVKAMDPLGFANDIDHYHILPWSIGVRVAFYLPWLEIFCGLALILRRLYSGAVSILLALMVVFIGATITAKVRGIDITCGCFGHASKDLSFTWHLVLDFAILAALLFLVGRGRTRVSD